MSAETQIQRLLDSGNIEHLFLKALLWDKATGFGPAYAEGDEGRTWNLPAVAAKRNFVVFECDGIPNASERARIERAVTRRAIENLIVYKGENGQREVVWTESRPGRAPHPYVHHYDAAAPNHDLIQRLAQLRFTLGEHKNLNLVTVRARVQQALAADKVTKTFYDNFSKQHAVLVENIENISDDDDRSWYASVLMNRLMFLYFLQRKGFLDNDTAYLRNRMERVRKLRGPDNFYTFFKKFLLPLFHTSLAARNATLNDPEIVDIIGDVPYLNGGMFARHQLETTYEDLDVPDVAFETVFAFFDSWKWTLDDRGAGSGNEINPDILGYIFERYINQKQMGAYYTKEDVTGYMTAVTIVPWLLDRMTRDLTARGRTFDPYQRLRIEPERYMYASALTGVDASSPEGFPSTVETLGFTEHAGEPASDKYGLPGETWIECFDRINHQRSLSQRIADGEVTSSQSAVTENINLIAFITDVLRDPESPHEVDVAYAALKDLSVLDPACGSGAFLFAALDLLVVLYRTCIATMEAYLAHDALGIEPELAERFRSIVESADAHTSRDYFLYKSATINNLYGVDLMPEAIEIAKLRLFLSLVAHVDKREDLDPLPDLDFNLRAGNSLVGFASKTEVEGVLSATFDGEERLREVIEKSNIAGAAYDTFIAAQVATEQPDNIADLKANVDTALAATRDVLDAALAAEYGMAKQVKKWRRVSDPFHWYTEFYSVMNTGGFDVVAGNPPYVARGKVDYQIRNLATADARDIYAPMTERAATLCAPDGRLTMIVPISSQFADEYAPLRKVIEDRFPARWISAFSRNPAALFDAGLGVRSTIIVAGPGDEAVTYVTRQNRWVEAARPALFEALRYTRLPDRLKTHGWMRLTDDKFAKMADALVGSNAGGLAANVSKQGEYTLGFKTTALYWLSVFDEDPPAYEPDGTPTDQTKVGYLRFRTERERDLALAILLSKFAFAWWIATGDDFDVTGKGLARTPMIVHTLPKAVSDQLVDALNDIRKRLPETVMFTMYAKKWMGNYAIPEVRDLTDKIDRILAKHYGYEDALGALDLAYYTAYKPTGERPGTMRTLPFL